ncbi:Juxtaposed with another zinc finger protein 1 [Operophtera brumata]|uniref:Juxtaposed with another zinc finger protein 1 n=1 Tax=Operophtera brumata TaxID=104452 RepID=A0A0L7LHS0_OPEBR|nr:Juxtaposed with another zinc finger protein 1 [Operophtera brumata]
MAVFMLNICKFKGCGITFPRLPDLIEHIEDVHIDLDPKVVEQKEASQPQYISLSYVLKYISEHSRRDVQSDVPEARRRLLSLPEPPVVQSPTGRTPTQCRERWAPRRRRNPSRAPVKKAYKCKCGKSYKTAQNLKIHSAVHTATTLAASALPTPESPRGHATKMPGLVVTAAPARTQNEDKAVRVYDTIKARDAAFTIPKYGLTGASSVSAGQIRHAIAVTSSPTDKMKVTDRNPKVTVHNQPFGQEL